MVGMNSKTIDLLSAGQLVYGSYRGLTHLVTERNFLWPSPNTLIICGIGGILVTKPNINDHNCLPESNGLRNVEISNHKFVSWIWWSRRRAGKCMLSRLNVWRLRKQLEKRYFLWKSEHKSQSTSQLKSENHIQSTKCEQKHYSRTYKSTLYELC